MKKKQKILESDLPIDSSHEVIEQPNDEKPSAASEEAVSPSDPRSTESDDSDSKLRRGEAAINTTSRDLGGFSFNKGEGRLVTPLCAVLYFDEREKDSDIVVAVPAKTQTWLVAQSFVSAVHNLIPEFDDRIQSLNYDISDAVLQEARNRGSLSREVLTNIVGYLAKFRDFIGLTALARERSNPSGPDLASSFAAEDDPYILVSEFKKYLALGSNSGTLLDILNGAFPPAQVNSILYMAIDNVDRYLIRGVLSPAVMRFALEDQISATSDWSNLVGTLTLVNSERAVRDLQELYRYAALSRTLDALGNKITDLSAGSVSLATLIQIFNLFANFDGPIVHIPVQKVIRTSLRAAGFSTDTKDAVPGQFLIRELKAIPDEFNFEVTRLQMMRFYCSLLYFFTKRSSSVKQAWNDKAGVSSQSLAMLTLSSENDTKLPAALFSHLLSSYRSVPYFENHPDCEEALRLEARDDEAYDRLDALFNRFFVREVFTLAVSGEVGSFKNRLLSLMDERSLERSDVWNSVLDAALSADSIYFEAWLRASKKFYDLAIDSDIYYPGDTAFICDSLSKGFSSVLSEFSTSVLPNTHPASILEGSIMTQTMSDPFTGADTLRLTQDWTLDDAMIRKSSSTDTVYDPLSDTFSEFFSAELAGGSYFDIPSMFPRGVHMYRLSRSLKVHRLLADPITSSLLAETDLGQFLLSHPNFEALVKTGFAEHFLRDGSLQWTVYYSPDDVATRMNIPLPLAVRLWDQGLSAMGSSLRYLVTYTGPRTRFLVLPEILAPFKLYEREPEIGSTIIKVPYPYQAARTYKGCLDALPDLSVRAVTGDTVTTSRPTDQIPSVSVKTIAEDSDQE